MNLTQEEKRIRIAEACGVHTKHCRGWTMDHGGYRWEHFNSEIEADRYNELFESENWKKEIYTNTRLLPDYFGSLDAMAKARKSITPDQQVQYSVELVRLAVSHLPSSRAAWMDFYIADASAAQHAEAFGRTLNLW